MGIRYRPEIDGLRAIAVSAVVLYHAGLGSAGYVGVDVFFVISGYLITSLLLREHSTSGTIDLVAFYARRVRRIFPAAIALVLAVLAASFVLLPAQAFIHTANSAGAAALFAANFFFQSVTGGYFDARSEEMPLLHLWSLAVEEQFYFVWPALLLVLMRWRPSWLRPALIVSGLASLLLAEVLMRTNPEAAFYQMPARFWELAAGGILASLPNRPMARWFSAGGVLLTLVACVMPSGHFPGLGALPAVVGAVAVIAAVHGGGSNRFLASAPMRGIGLISYSLYLWHWPLLALYRATSIGEGSQAVRLELCADAVVLAIASYRYIEQPFRRMKFPPLRMVAAGASLSATLAIGACAWGYQTERNLPTASPLELAAAAAERDHLSLACHADAGAGPALKCPRNPAAVEGIWGDSMAWSWTPFVTREDPRAVIATRDACGPFLGYLPEHAMPGDRNCAAFTQAVPAQLQGLRTLYLVARWENDPAKFAALERSLQAVAPTVGNVVLIGPTPEMRDLVPRCIGQGDPEACSISRAQFDTQSAGILTSLRGSAAKFPNVGVWDAGAQLCDRDQCSATRDGKALYWDSHHLTVTGALSLRREIPTATAGASR